MTKHLHRSAVRFAAALFLLFVWGGCAKAADCAECHDQAQKIAKSAHTGLDCTTCHDSHEKYPHPAGVAKPVCANCHTDQAGDYARSAHELLSPKTQAFRTSVPDTCSMCHTDVVDQYRASVHGKALARGVAEAP